MIELTESEQYLISHIVVASARVGSAAAQVRSLNRENETIELAQAVQYLATLIADTLEQINESFRDSLDKSVSRIEYLTTALIAIRTLRHEHLETNLELGELLKGLQSNLDKVLVEYEKQLNLWLTSRNRNT